MEITLLIMENHGIVFELLWEPCNLPYHARIGKGWGHVSGHHRPASEMAWRVNGGLLCLLAIGFFMSTGTDQGSNFRDLTAC